MGPESNRCDKLWIMKKVGNKSGGASNRKILWAVIGLFVAIPVLVIGYAVYDAGASRAKLEKIHEQIAEPEWKLLSIKESGNYECFKSCTGQGRQYITGPDLPSSFLQSSIEKVNSLGYTVTRVDSTCQEVDETLNLDCFVEASKDSQHINIYIIDQINGSLKVTVGTGYESHLFGFFEER